MARKLPGIRSSHRLKIVVTILVGIIVLFASHQVMLPPNLVPVAVLTTAVPAQTAIAASDIQWVDTENPPTTVLTQSQSDLLATLVPNQALPAGASIPVSALVPPGTATTLTSGEVPWSVSVSGDSATYFTLGGRTSIWATLGSNPSPVLIAEGVRVIGMFNSAGAPVAPTPGNAATAPSSLSLAIPQADLQTFLGLQAPTVEPDSTVTHFMLDEGGSPTTASTFSGSSSGVSNSGQSGSAGGIAPASSQAVTPSSLIQPPSTSGSSPSQGGSASLSSHTPTPSPSTQSKSTSSLSQGSSSSSNSRRKSGS